MACTILLLFAACSSRTADLVDLDKVLDIMVATLDELKDTPVAWSESNNNAPATRVAAQENRADNMQIINDSLDQGAINDSAIHTIEVSAQSDVDNDIFLKTFANNLNAAELTNQPIGTAILGDGSVAGFIDANSNAVKDANEKQIFSVEIDAERNRLIATDTQYGYHRPRGFSMGGIFTGYLLGSMLGRQRHSGISSSKFTNMQMSNRNYYQGAAAKHRSKVSGSGVRAKSSSGSFRGGK